MRIEPIKIGKTIYYTAYEKNRQALGRTRAEAVHNVILEVINARRPTKTPKEGHNPGFFIPYYLPDNYVRLKRKHAQKNDKKNRLTKLEKWNVQDVKKS